MSAITIDLLDYLRNSGMRDEDARRVAEYVDKRVGEALREAGAKASSSEERLDQRVQDALREAKAHADEKIKASAENAKAREAEFAAKFVSVDKYHERDRTLATREDLNAAISELRKDFRTEMAELRKDIRTIYRILVIGFIGGFGAVIAGIIALIAKSYFGV